MSGLHTEGCCPAERGGTICASIQKAGRQSICVILARRMRNEQRARSEEGMEALFPGRKKLISRNARRSVLQLHCDTLMQMSCFCFLNTRRSFAPEKHATCPSSRPRLLLTWPFHHPPLPPGRKAIRRRCQWLFKGLTIILTD